jgi:cytochrome c2
MQYLSSRKTRAESDWPEPVFRGWPPFGVAAGLPYVVSKQRLRVVRDAGTLDRHFTAPGQVMAGTLMTYPGLPDGHQRADLIAYLVTLR